MDIGDIRGLLTAVLLASFIGVWAWSWSRRRRKDFGEAEQLPLEDDKRPPRGNHEKGQGS